MTPMQKTPVLLHGAGSRSDRQSGALPLCVELDGTLLRNTLLSELLARLLAQRPLLILLVPFWALRGRVRVQQEIARRVTLDPALLPYNSAVLNWLRGERSSRRTLALTTISDGAHARHIAEYLGLFDQVIAVDRGQKPVLLQGDFKGGYAYAGAFRRDLDLWRNASEAILVGKPALAREIRSHHPDVLVIESMPGGWRLYANALRIRQWVKNILIYVPLIAAHKFLEPALAWKATVCVVLFGMCSSAQYILNDLIDLEADRKHPIKRKRPFASGELSLNTGFVLAPMLVAFCMAGAFRLSPAFAALLLGYLVLALSYSLWFKRFVLLDTFLLSGFYMLRIVAGHLVTGVAFSVWLLAFAFFLFLSLAFNKRWIELLGMEPSESAVVGRGYRATDASQINLFGVCSAFLSTVVFILYLQSDRVKELYHTPELLWFLSPVYLYWLSRVWILSGRGGNSEDPVLMVLMDRASYVVALVSALILMVASADVSSILAFR